MGTFVLRQGAGSSYVYVPRAALLSQTARFRMCPATRNVPPFSLPLPRLWAACLLLVLDAVLLVVGMLCTPLQLPLLPLIPAAVPWLLLPQALPGPLLVLFLPVPPPRLLSLLLLLLLLKIISPLQPLRKLLGSSTQQNCSKKACGIISLLYVFLSFASAAAAAAITIAPPLLSAGSRHTVAAGQRLLHRAAAAGTEPLSWPAAAAVPSPSAAVLSLTGAGGVSPLCRTAAAATTSLLWPPLAAASSSRHLPAAALPFCSAAAALPSPCRRAAIPPAAAAAVPAAPPAPGATTDTRTTLPRTASTGRANAAAGAVDSRVAGKTSQATRTAAAPLAAATAVQAAAVAAAPAAAAPAATQHPRPAAAKVLPLPPLVAAPVRLAEAAAAAKCRDTAPAPLLRGTSLRVASAAAPLPVSAKPSPTASRAAAGPGRRKHLHVLCTCIGRREKELVLLLLLGPTPFFVNPLYVLHCSQAAAAAAAARQSSPCSAVSTRRKYLSTEPPQQQGRQRSRQQRPLFHQQFLPQGRNDGFLTRDARGMQENAAIAAAAPWTAVAALNRRGISCSYAPTTCALSSRPAAAAANVTAEAAGGAAAAAEASAAAAAGSTRARALPEERRAATAEGTALLEEKGADALAPAPGEATAAPGSAVAQNLSPVAAGRAARDAAHTSCGLRDTSERRKCVVFDLSDRLLPYDLAWRLQQTLLHLQLLRLQRRCSVAASSACLNYASAGATVGSSAAAAGTATAGAAVVPAVTASDVPHPSVQQRQQKQPALQRSQQEQQSVLLHGPQPQPPQQHQEFSRGQQVHRATQPERQLLHTEAETPEDYLLLLQHPSVYTVGQGGKTCNILFNSSIRQLRLTSAEQQELTTEEGCMQVLQQLLRQAAASPYAFSFQHGRAAAEAAGQDDDSKVRRCRRTDGGMSSTTGVNTDSNSGSTTSNTSDVSSSSTSNTSSSNGSCVGPVSSWISSSSSDFDVYRVERGGEATYHGPGQLVLYPVLDLRHHACDVKWYITSLEQVVINAVRRMATWSRVTGRKAVAGAGTTIRARSSKVSCRSSSRPGGPATAATAERDAFAETLARGAAETGKSEELPAQRVAAAARMSTAATSRFAAHAVRAVAQATAAATAETRATAEMRAAVATEAPAAAAATEAPPAGGALTGAAKQEVGGVLQDEIEVLTQNLGKTAVGVLTRRRQHATILAAAVAEADCSRWERRGESETKAPVEEGAAESRQQAAPAHEERAVQEAAAAGGQHPSRPLLRACSYREQAELASAAAATNQEVTDALLLNGVHRVEGLPGVWVDKKSKICSIGVKVKRWITQHGLALNITTDTRAFRRIVPCGLHGCVMQSLKQLIHSRASSHNRLWQRLEEGEEEEEEEEEKSLQLAEQHEKEDLQQQGLRRKEADGELRQQGRQTAEAELQPSGVEQGQQPCQAGDEQQKGQQQEGDRHRQPQQRKQQQQQLGQLRWHEQNQQRTQQEHEQHQDQQQQQQHLELQHVWQPHEQLKSMLGNEERREEVENRTAVLSLLPKGHDDANESSSCTSSANSSSSCSTTETNSPFSSRSSTDSNTDGTSSSRVREEQQRIAGASAAMEACSELPAAVSAPKKGSQQQPWKQKERDVNGREEATAICGSKQHRDSGSHSRFGYIEHSTVQEKQVHTADGREEEQREQEEEARRDCQLFRHVTALIKKEFSHVFDVHLIERY